MTQPVYRSTLESGTHRSYYIPVQSDYTKLFMVKTHLKCHDISCMFQPDLRHKNLISPEVKKILPQNGCTPHLLI